MFGVKFGDKHSFNDFGLIFNSKTISEPEAQVVNISVPGRNGSIDLTEVLTGDVRYNDRKLSIDFTIRDNVSKWEEIRQRIANEIHGKQLKIIFDDDISYYWYGRVSVGEIKPDGAIAAINISAIVSPYKYNITTSVDDWLWDPFDFETGIINETANIVVSGTKSVSIICSGKVENPIITADAQMTCSVDGGAAVTVNVGTEVNYDIVLTAGEHTLVFNGNGIISINYVGGSL